MRLNRVSREIENVSENFTTVGKGGKSLAFSAETVLKNLVQIQEARGKKVSVSKDSLMKGRSRVGD